MKKIIIFCVAVLLIFALSACQSSVKSSAKDVEAQTTVKETTTDITEKTTPKVTANQLTEYRTKQNTTVKTALTSSKELQNGKQSFKTYYYKNGGGGYSNSYSDYPLLKKITSVSELKSYYEGNKKNYIFKSITNDVFENSKYNDEFFKNKFLLLVVTMEPSSSATKYEAQSVDLKDNKVSVKFLKTVQPAGDGAIEYWHIFLELDKNLADKEITADINKNQLTEPGMFE